MQREKVHCAGFSLIELTAVLIVLGVLAMVVVPRLVGTVAQTKISACHTQKVNIEIQAQLWFRQKGTWPAADLHDLMAHRNYFPDGPVTCPVDGSVYRFDAATQRVVGHRHQ